MRLVTASLCALALCGPATAESRLVLNLDLAGDAEQVTTLYNCADDQTLSVRYINSAPNFLALLPVDGVEHLFVTTISASGARYVSGPYEWWSDGDEATLRDLMQDEDAPPLATCTAAGNTP